MLTERAYFFLLNPGAWLAVCLLAGPVHAETDALVRESMVLIEQGKAKEAFDRLAAVETERAGDPDFDTALGVAAKDSGQFTRAVFALERVLTVQPTNSYARAQLGLTLFALGDNQEARQLLQEARRENIPPEAVRKIDDFLQAIGRNEETSRSSMKAYVEAGLGKDSNINSGPANSNVAVPAFGGLLFTLTPTSVELKDDFHYAGAGISGRYVIDPRLSLIASANGNFRFNRRNGNFDTKQLELSGGASYRIGKDEFTAVAQIDTYDVDNARARDQRGIQGEWTYRADPASQWSTYVQLSRLRYPGQSLRDANRYVLGIANAQTFGSGFLGSGGIYLGSENVLADSARHLGHHLVGVRAGLQKSINADVDVFASLGHERRAYGGDDPLFLMTRQDRQTNANLGLSWVPVVGWRVTPQISLIRVRSNIAISDFTKQTLSITVRKDI